MAENWADQADVAMDNPLGGSKRGRDDIEAMYTRIFAGPAQVYVEFYEYSVHESENMFYVVGRERGWLRQRETRIDLAIRTSRIFKRINGQWKQVHHHGSIDDAALLARYQAVVMGTNDADSHAAALEQ